MPHAAGLKLVACALKPKAFYIKMDNLKSILTAFGVNEDAIVNKISGGLINATWKVTDSEREFILQKINTQVFKSPEAIAENHCQLSKYLKHYQPDYPFVSEIPTVVGDTLFKNKEGCFRLLPFVKDSHTILVVQNPSQAYEAAYQFGLFTKMFEEFNTRALKTTIPDFHDLALRYQQFEESIRFGSQERVGECQQVIQQLKSFSYLVAEYKEFTNHPQSKLRVTHHDTKISNVLFNQQDKGICVIDLDTVMSGYFFSDVGDMMRTYLSPANEEELDFTNIIVREEFFKAIASGYLAAMGSELTAHERNSLCKAGYWITYMQALRFLTDYFSNDQYYGAAYPDHNLNRAKNQFILLQSMTDKDDLLKSILHSIE
jgi:thiamine kinase-like enzyme